MNPWKFSILFIIYGNILDIGLLIVIYFCILKCLACVIFLAYCLHQVSVLQCVADIKIIATLGEHHYLTFEPF